MKRARGTAALAAGWISVVLAAAAPPVGAQSARTTWDGVYTEAQAARGAGVYTARCSQCHAETLGGAESAPALTGVVFNATWEGVPLNELVERIRLSMPLDQPGSVSRPQIADLVAYVLQVGKFPAGASELPADAGTLSQITFRSYKP